MLNLVLQPSISSFSKAAKVCKSSSLNSPFSEEEEDHPEKETKDDLMLFSENEFSVPEFQPVTTLAWAKTQQDCLFYSSDILIPPPKI